MMVAFSPAVMLSLVLRLLGSPSAPNLALSGGCLSNWLLAFSFPGPFLPRETRPFSIRTVRDTGGSWDHTTLHRWLLQRKFWFQLLHGKFVQVGSESILLLLPRHPRRAP